VVVHLAGPSTPGAAGSGIGLAGLSGDDARPAAGGMRERMSGGAGVGLSSAVVSGKAPMGAEQLLVDHVSAVLGGVRELSAEMEHSPGAAERAAVLDAAAPVDVSGV